MTFIEACHVKAFPELEQDVFNVITCCEVFTAISGYPGPELASIKVGLLTWDRESGTQDTDKFALEALEKVLNSRFSRHEWANDLADLKLRLSKVSAEYNDYRLNPGRGVSALD